MICGCLIKKLNELPELIFPIVILAVSVILLLSGIILNSTLPNYSNMGDSLIIIGGLLTFFTGTCLCSVWDGKYREKKKEKKVVPLRQINIQITKQYVFP